MYSKPDLVTFGIATCCQVSPASVLRESAEPLLPQASVAVAARSPLNDAPPPTGPNSSGVHVCPASRLRHGLPLTQPRTTPERSGAAESWVIVCCSVGRVPIQVGTGSARPGSAVAARARAAAASTRFTSRPGASRRSPCP
ncbi:MAG: hypothetical protein QOE45_15 [Frankiaceae bacterium]|jgi:hypothetical protein|nr:hypothetical protein [Frankiaceae bacterium]